MDELSLSSETITSPEQQIQFDIPGQNEPTEKAGFELAQSDQKSDFTDLLKSHDHSCMECNKRRLNVCNGSLYLGHTNKT
jgi:hypothetical protein